MQNQRTNTSFLKVMINFLAFLYWALYVLFDSPQAPKNIAEEVIANMKKKYNGKPVFYITEPCEGTRVLTLPK
jgi:hypothetical protein